MKSIKAFAAASCLGLLTFVPSAMADQWNKRTIITVNEPIQVPGKTLEPGKYVMKLLDSPSNRHIVQIFNEREDQLQTTILAIPNYRLQPTGQTEFGWWEVPAGQPKAMRAWFYPGDNFGQEFAYPKNTAVSIASANNNATVPTTYAQNETELTTARVGSVDSKGTEMELDRETYNPPTQTAQTTTPSTPAPADNTYSQNRTTQNQDWNQSRNQTTTSNQGYERSNDRMMASNMDRGQDRMRSLPRTGSEMPLFGLAGFLALGAGFAFRAVASRS